MDGGREVGWNVGADGVGKGYGLEGEDVRESEFGDLGEVETVALEYLGDVRPEPWGVIFRTREGRDDKRFSVPRHN